MKNILITGASGMLGSTVLNFFSKVFNVFGTDIIDFEGKGYKYMKFDLSDENYDDLINWSKPNIIIHCGALTDGNYCEENPSNAFNVNGISVLKLLESTTNNVKIIYISSDAVFSSNIHLAMEKNCVSPENIYGKSKELGEFFLKTSVDRDYIIIRTTIVGTNLNKGKNSFVEWIVNSAKEKNKINLFDDVLFTPISIWDLIKEIDFLIKNSFYKIKTIHIAGSEVVSKYDFGKLLLKNLSIDDKFIEKGSISNFSKRAKRSSNQSLDCKLYENYYKRKLPNLIQTINSITNNQKL